MNREEYLAMLDTEPATPTQRGAVMGEFARLGFHPRRDRAERLAACARLLGLDALDSTAGLTMGQAGQLVNTLRHVRDRAELAAITRGAELADDGQDHDDASGADDGELITLPEAIARIMLLIAMAVYGRDLPTGSGNIAPDIRRPRMTGHVPAQGRANLNESGSPSLVTVCA